eukprot:SAG25_NODE_37_length_19691_cov_19.319467_26_plen_155_part_00
MQACTMMFRENLSKGQTLWKRGDPADTFHIVLRGQCGATAAGKEERLLRMGAQVGEDALIREQEGGKQQPLRQCTVVAQSDTVLATVTSEDYARIFEVDEVMQLITKFWDLITLEHHDHTPETNRADVVNFVAYAQFHQRVSKSIQATFNRREE